MGPRSHSSPSSARSARVIGGGCPTLPGCVKRSGSSSVAPRPISVEPYAIDVHEPGKRALSAWRRSRVTSDVPVIASTNDDVSYVPSSASTRSHTLGMQ